MNGIKKKKRGLTDISGQSIFGLDVRLRIVVRTVRRARM